LCITKHSRVGAGISPVAWVVRRGGAADLISISGRREKHQKGRKRKGEKEEERKKKRKKHKLEAEMI